MERTIALNATGERITFLNTPKNLFTDSLEIIVVLPASGEGPPLHIHSFQAEQFIVESGTLGLVCDGKEISLEKGESFTVPENTAHRCFAKGGKEVVAKAIFTPALHIEYALTEIFGACNRKKSKDPSPFDATFVLLQSPREYYLADIPRWVQNSIFPLMGRMGRVLGISKVRSLKEFQQN